VPNIVALTNGSPHSWIILNAIIDRFGPITVLTEGKQSKAALIRQRRKRLGLLRVVGQMGFTALQIFVGRRSRPRIRQIIQEQGLDPTPNAAARVVPVGSVNSPACREALLAARPEVVIVFGTRLIRAETLSCIRVPMLNLHSGITPKYRGQAGGYWALAMGDPEHAGVTVHLLDAGVDTGAVVQQAPFEAGPQDTFATYFYLQAAVLRGLTIRAIDDILGGTLKTLTPDLPSKQYYHPTLWGYLRTGLGKGVW
jgi:methionyl-tRNA formyltransferase